MNARQPISFGAVVAVPTPQSLLVPAVALGAIKPLTVPSGIVKMLSPMMRRNWTVCAIVPQIYEDLGNGNCFL